MARDDKWSRRDFLKTSAAGGLSLMAFSMVNCGKKVKFPLGIQSYSLRGFSVEEAIAKTHELGVQYIEIFPGQLPGDSGPDTIAKVKAALEQNKVVLDAYGVVGLTNDREADKVYFELAKSMGFASLSADPDPTPDTLALLDKLVDEYKVKIAIHNHGPGSRYSTPEDVLQVIDGHHANIGACVDTGHYLRSNVDPVDAIRKLGTRVHGVHLKDWAGVEGEWPVFGEGRLDMIGVFQAMKEVKFDGFLSIEYEAHPDEPMEYLKACVAATREAMAKAAV